MKEFLTRVKKIWQSEISSFNKVFVDNTFAIAVPTIGVGIIDWTIKEIKEMDVRTRKQLMITGNLLLIEDVDNLYLPRLQGVWGLKIETSMTDSRVIAVA